MKSFLILLLLLFAARTEAAIYYVGHGVGDSNNNSCNTATTNADGSRKATGSGASGAIACMSAGDSVVWRDGTYNDFIDSTVQTIVSGSVGSPTKFLCSPGELCKLRPLTHGGVVGLNNSSFNNNLHDILVNGQASSNCVPSTNTTYSAGPALILTCNQGFVFDSSATESQTVTVATQGGSNITLSHFEAFNLQCIQPGDSCKGGDGTGGTTIGVMGVQTGGGTINTPGLNFSWCNVHDNGRVNGGTAPSGIGYGFYAAPQNSSISNCAIHNNGGYGIHLFNSTGGVSNVSIFGNEIYSNGLTAGENTAGMILASGPGIIAYNNVLYGNFQGIQLGSGINNTSYALIENTLFGNTHQGIILPGSPPQAGSKVQNNISWGNSSLDIDDQGASQSTIAISNNLCSTISTYCMVTTDPLFVNSAAHDFHLTSKSPAIDKGVLLATPYNVDFDGNVRPSPAGGAYDIGAFEFNSSAPVLRTLNIASSNPASGCQMNFTPDNGGSTQASTPVSAVYFNGTTVTITPQDPCGGNNFSKWQLDGVDYSVNANVQVTMSADHTMTVFYGSPPSTRNLIVTSINPGSGAHINVSPNDTQGRNSVVTGATRVYNVNSQITLTARPHVNDPLICIKFEEGSGTTAADSCNSGLSGTLVNGATWVAGNPGNAVSFSNGTNQYISIPDSNLFSNLPGFDVSIDVKPTSGLSGFVAAIGKNYVWYLYASSTGYSNASSQACTNGPLGYFQDTQGGGHTVCSTTPLASGVWTNLRMRFNGSLFELLINGSVVDHVNPAALVANSAGLVQIGASQFGENLVGAVDNLNIYDSYESDTSPGNAFNSWSGCTSGSGVTCGVSLTGDKQVTATYAGAQVQRVITVNTVNPSNVTGMSVDTVDINNSPTTGLTAPFTRTYFDSSVQLVTFTTPSTSGSNTFISWTGCDSVNGTSCHVFPNANRTITATYSSPTVRALTITSVNPASGAGITGITSDLSSQTSCTTPNCALTYNDATAVVATAPATVGSNTFSAWTGCNSVSGTGNRTCNVTMSADKTVTATYLTPVAACTTGVKAGSVSITVKGNALIANCNGG